MSYLNRILCCYLSKIFSPSEYGKALNDGVFVFFFLNIPAFAVRQFETDFMISGVPRYIIIGKKGEIVIRGENVMAGYWKNPESTADTVRDGWLYTGDMAKRDADGFIYVAGARQEGEGLVSAGGRVLGVTAVADDLPTAIQKAYERVGRVDFANGYTRSDIGARAMLALQK